MLGGAMRQVGIFAAAGTHALDHHLPDLVVDHENARLIGERLTQAPGIDLDLGTVQTNIVVFDLAEGAPDAAAVVTAARECGVLVNALGARRIRVLTHRDVTRAQCAEAAAILAAAAAPTGPLD
jgi:threonine aldolase